MPRTASKSPAFEVRAELDRAASDEPIDRLRRGLLAVATLYDADADTSRPMVRHWVRRGGPVLPHADDTAELFRDVLSTGQAEGRVRTDLDADVAAQVLLDVYLGRLYRWAADGGVLRRELEPAIAVVLDALRPAE